MKFTDNAHWCIQTITGSPTSPSVQITITTVSVYVPSFEAISVRPFWYKYHNQGLLLPGPFRVWPLRWGPLDKKIIWGPFRFRPFRRGDVLTVNCQTTRRLTQILMTISIVSFEIYLELHTRISPDFRYPLSPQWLISRETMECGIYSFARITGAPRHTAVRHLA